MSSQIFVIGQIDHVSYKGMMGSGTTHVLWPIKKSKTFFFPHISE